MLLIIAAITYGILSRIFKTLEVLSAKMQLAGTGDLTIQMDELPEREWKDEVKMIVRSFINMITNFKKLIEETLHISGQLAATSRELATAGDQVGSVAEEVGGAVQDVAAGAEEQSAQIESMTELVDKLSHLQENLMNRSQDISKIADTTMLKIDEGSIRVERSIEQIRSVKVVTEEARHGMTVLGKKSDEIGTIIALIRNIAAQTNLLALNAAIETARAGDAGRGFSVVAGEIRSLAEESTTAAEKITQLIHGVQQDVGNSIMKMKENAALVDASNMAIVATGQVFSEIQTITEKLHQFIGEISKHIEEMNQFSSQVKKTMREIHQASFQFSSHAEEVAASNQEQLAATEEIIASSKRLAEMADNLIAVVNRFKI